jgi:hypothetical protein
MADKYRIDPDFVMPDPTPANFFCTVSEEEFTEAFRADLIARWRQAGVKQMRTTLINDQYPQEPYPHGVWVEGWTDENARMLPFGEAGSPPLVALEKSA